MIGGYGVDKFGQPLFYPSSEEYKARSRGFVAARPARVENHRQGGQGTGLV